MSLSAPLLHDPPEVRDHVRHAGEVEALPQFLKSWAADTVDLCHYILLAMTTLQSILVVFVND